MDEDLDLIQGFMEESAELVESFERGLLELEQTPDDPEVLNRIFRAAHTIKGNSAMLGFTDVAQFTHSLEDVLDRMRKGRLRVNQAGMNLLLRSLDMLKLKLKTLSQPADASPDATALIAELRAYAEGGDRPAQPVVVAPVHPAADPGAAPTKTSATDSPHAAAAEAGEEDEHPRPKLGEILVTQAGVSQEEIEAALQKQKRVGEILVEGKVVTPEQVARALEIQAAATPKGDAASIRVHTEKVDKLVNLVGEMVITQSMLAQAVSRFSADQLSRLHEAVEAMERHTRDLQERVMAVRMQPIKTVFGRFHRLVRDLAGTLGKHIRLEVTGEETELDKTVIDRIGDPLTHLVRNCVDHGVEPPDTRTAAGKPAQGVVGLHAFHQGGSIFIEVRDDGRGLDTARIRRKALENGLTKEGDALTDEQVYALIFRPGFSTAERVTDVSGRGVGMDVVQRNIVGLGGQVAIASAPGRGTTFTIKLPLTLAILDGLSVLVGDETYIIPLVNITESIRPKAGEV
jgi:chemotaxis protein histidine kinase CheA